VIFINISLIYAFVERFINFATVYCIKIITIDHREVVILPKAYSLFSMTLREQVINRECFANTTNAKNIMYFLLIISAYHDMC